MNAEDAGPRLVLAPLHGVTTRIFRKAYLGRFPGFDEAMAPFILSVKVDRMKETHFKDLIPDPEPGLPLVPQILGNDAEGFIATAKVLADLGYPEVNWNLGCPYPMVTKKGRGSGLLPHPDRIAAFLDEACSRLPIPLSVKLRLGLSDPGEILAIMPILNAHPLLRLTIHARIGTQMYKGEVNLEGFEAAARLSTHRLAYNGDIKNLETFKALQKRFPAVQEWMLGRWALYDPFLAGAIKGLPPQPEPLVVLEAFHDEIYQGYRGVLFGPGHVLDKMKEIWTYLGRYIGGAGKEISAISQARALPAYEASVGLLFKKARWLGS